MPTIKKTPGDFEGAHFDFKELLELQIKEEVTIAKAIRIGRYSYTC